MLQSKDKFLLLEKLAKLCPNAYIELKHDDQESEFIPTRTEIYNLWSVRKSLETGMAKTHKDLPIILTFEEDEKVAYDFLRECIIYEPNFLKMHELQTQVRIVLTLARLCDAQEMRKLIGEYNQMSLETWIALMDYPLALDFLHPEDNMKICHGIYMGKWYSEYANSYYYSLWHHTLESLEREKPNFFRALKYFNVNLDDMKKKYKYVKYSGGGGPN